MRRVLSLVLGCIVSALVVGIPSTAGAAVITAVPSSGAVLVGQEFNVAFDLDSFTDLYFFQLSVTYDASLLSVVSFTEGSHLSTGGSTDFVDGTDDTAGTITFIIGTLVGPVPGVNNGGTLFRVRFSAGATGTAAVAPFVDGGNGDGLFDSVFAQTAPGVAGATITINPAVVPEPGTVSLLAIGAALAIARRRRRRSAPATR